MNTNEPLIKSGCQYFFNTPSGNVKNLFFYPTIIGDFTYLPGYIKQRSSFDSYLLMFVESGSLELETSGSKEVATAGTIVFLNCYLPHSYGSPNGAHVLWFHFDGVLAKDYYNEFYSRNGNVILPSNPHEFREMFVGLLSNFTNQKEIDEISLSLSITSILTGLFAGSVDNYSITSNSIRHALSYISEHFTEDVSLNELADIAGLSPYYFSRAFKKETGVSPHQYVINTRISFAKYYLSSSQKSISEIAHDSGFKDESAFCFTFKKREGVTPKEYRKPNV